MDGYTIFMVLLAAYIGLLVAIGCFFNTRQTSLREFLLAGRRAGGLVIGFSAASSWLTAGGILAVVGFFMLLGMGSIWGFVAPNIIALLLIALLVRKIRSIPAMTQPELLEIRYGAFVRLPVALIIIVVMILFAVADIKGFAMVLQVFYGIGKVHAALIVSLSVAAYVTLGGMSAVIATDSIQFLLLSAFILVMSLVVLGDASEATGLSVGQMAGTLPDQWWNPLSIGLPMVVVFCVAILPGWISEQDPWQKIWAARGTSSARKGMVIGSLLVTLVFAGCAAIALGLQYIYPEISGMGFPMGMAKAEPALLAFVVERGLGSFWLALCAVALAAAAMSCTDTFAASGGSCIARDIYQRFIDPAVSMSEMLVINRLGVLCIIGCATAGSFFIDSIIDAIHIATFIASASYFFALMGGLYWRRGTAAGAAASMAIGFVCQCTLIVIDLGRTPTGAPPYLESLHPVLMGHGVIVAMGLSGLAYVGVSLVTAPAPTWRLAPFFADQSRRLVAGRQVSQPAVSIPCGVPVVETIEGGNVHLRLQLALPGHLPWRELLGRMVAEYGHWLALGGDHSLRRCTRPEIVSCVSLVRGARSEGWLEVEGLHSSVEELRREVAMAYAELEKLLAAMLTAEQGEAKKVSTGLTK
ncbi:MAG: sodium:solute symporter [Desulfopila sp.]